jgi:hypothetical protein
VLRRDIWFAAVGVWAFAGIYLKRTSLEVDHVESVIIAAIIGMVALSAGIIVRIMLSAHRKSLKRP